MIMIHAAENEDLFDRLDDWVEKKILFWADKDMLYAWTQAFFRYAALRTLLKRNQTPKQLLAAAASCGLSGS
jgi:hypothetical protein